METALYDSNTVMSIRWSNDLKTRLSEYVTLNDLDCEVHYMTGMQIADKICQGDDNQLYYCNFLPEQTRPIKFKKTNDPFSSFGKDELSEYWIDQLTNNLF